MSPFENDPPYLPGESPERDAWYTAFFIENHLDHFSYPEIVATPEQVRFMVYTDEDERYYPCSDRMFEAIMNKNQSDFLQEKYNEALQRVLNLVKYQIEDKVEQEYLESLIKIKFRHETRDEIMIPSRLEKRLIRIFINRTQIEDPYFFEKSIRNRRVSNALNSDTFVRAISLLDIGDFDFPATLVEIRELANYLELKRLLALSVDSSLWESDISATYTEKDFIQIFNRQMSGGGIEPLFDFIGVRFPPKLPDLQHVPQPKKILWLPDEAGEILVDFMLIRYLVKLGHKIIIALKEGPLYTKPDIQDTREDEILRKELEGALFITEKNLGKNELVKILRSDNRIIVMSDGTRENVNLLLASTTFARVFKEVDGIISRGLDQKRRFFDSHFQFTQNIFNISKGEAGVVSISFKPKHPFPIKFSHGDLEKKAKTIIEQMEDAKKKGITVTFYSGIIGSIPGKIKTAKQIMSIFIQYLKDQSAMTFIINPAEYFEPGMDADDLMYMWEIVQSSGLIDIWRFQTYEDIALAFQIMGRKVPPEWVGKDATFSTGCTKEMKIALEVQQKHPEMQIIGPSREKFTRRNEYGIGKMYDQRIGEISWLQ
ncbi:MAG: hypothetical protein JRI99_13265 [Deltaproteobacteria bacterium]|nr:hypothetical protein [Deltaproteobacteria bacterium]